MDFAVSIVKTPDLINEPLTAISSQGGTKGKLQKDLLEIKQCQKENCIWLAYLYVAGIIPGD